METTDEHRCTQKKASAAMEDIDSITQKIIGCAFTVGNVLGVGFLEKVYENAMAIELRKIGLEVESQKSMSVFYEGQAVGYYIGHR